MSVNGNTLVIDFMGTFNSDSYRGLLRDFLAGGLDPLMSGREYNFDRSTQISESHRRLVVDYTGGPLDEAKLDTTFNTVAFLLPSFVSSRVKKVENTNDGVDAYIVEAHF